MNMGDDVRTKSKKSIERESWTWSPTQLKSLATCPYQFYLRYVKRVNTELPEIVKDGLRIHDEIFSDLEKGTNVNPVSDIIRTHLKEENVTIEPKVELVQVVDGIPARIKGLPDIVTNSEIYDFKTTADYALERVSRADRLQMNVYSLATGKPAKIVKIPREGFPYVRIHEIPLDIEIIKDIPKLIREGRKILKGEVPQPKRTSCRYCFLRTVCPYSPDLDEELAKELGVLE